MDWIRNMKLALRILVALLVVVAATGAEQSCGSDRNKPNPKATSATPVKRIVEIRAYSKGPYHVLFIVTDPKTNGLQRRVGPELVAGGEYKQQIEYDSGEVVGIQLLVWGNAADTMRCSITDGPKVDSQTRNKEVLCLLLTSQ